MDSETKAISWGRAFRLAAFWFLPCSVLTTLGVGFLLSAPERIDPQHGKPDFSRFMGFVAVGMLLIDLGLLIPGWTHRSWKVVSLLALLEIYAVWLLLLCLKFLAPPVPMPV